MVLNRRGGIHYIDGLVQERRNSIANALELRLFCTKPSTRNRHDTVHGCKRPDGTYPLSCPVWYGRLCDTTENISIFFKFLITMTDMSSQKWYCLNVVRIAVILSRTGELKHHTYQDDSEEGVENISTNILQDAGDRGFSLFAMNLKIITLTGMIYNHGSSKGIQGWLRLHAEKLNSLIEFYRKFVCTLYTAVVPKSILFS